MHFPEKQLTTNSELSTGVRACFFTAGLSFSFLFRKKRVLFKGCKEMTMYKDEIAIYTKKEEKTLNRMKLRYYHKAVMASHVT